MSIDYTAIKKTLTFRLTVGGVTLHIVTYHEIRKFETALKFQVDFPVVRVSYQEMVAFLVNTACYNEILRGLEFSHTTHRLKIYLFTKS